MSSIVDENFNKFLKEHTTNGKKLIFIKFLNLVKSNKNLLIKCFLASLLITFLGLGVAFYFQLLIDSILPGKLTSSFNTLTLGFTIISIYSIFSYCSRKRKI